MIQLDQKIYLYALVLLPIMVVGFLLLQIWKKKAQQRFSEPDLLKKLAPNKSNFKNILKLIIQVLGVGCVVLALVNPKAGTKLETVQREGVDIVFAVDVSKSMLAEDIAPNRMEKAKRLVSEIINELASDRIGIIAYAAQAYPQLPITTDYGAAKMFLQGMNTDMLSSQGTAISDAIELATTYYNDAAQTNRVLFIVSDGEDHSNGNATAAVSKALDANIKIFTVGVGTEKGGPIPIREKGVLERLKRDAEGEVVITKLQQATLLDIAQEGNGQYIDGSNTAQAVAQIKEALNQMDKMAFEAKQFSDYKDQFQWFLGAALVLFLLDLFIFEGKTAWIARLNLFNEKEEEV
ncbi:MAG: VWA domain-containing protein [Flavobacteriaceae bacterium]|nr:VWA domain-containing protein [Flavobacteriaceae bacterium]MCI5087961.1 VWA domain-containing protein [Flavobacteriaceae bacterium]